MRNHIKVFLIIAYSLKIFLGASSAFSAPHPKTLPEVPPPSSVFNETFMTELKKRNGIAVAEIQNGIAALQNKDINSAVQNFEIAMAIAPYDPMAYTLLIRTLIFSDQEDIAYKILEKSGRNLTDSDQIISNLYAALKEAYPPMTDAPLALVSIAPFKDNKEGAISFIFDDGEKSVATDILPMFEHYGFKTTVALNPGWIPERGTENRSRGTWREWRKAYAQGHEIANHGMSHKALPGLSTEELSREVDDSYKVIKEKIGATPLTFVFPESKSNLETIEYVKKNHLAIREHDELAKVYSRICIPTF